VPASGSAFDSTGLRLSPPDRFPRSFPRSGMQSTVEAGGADPDNARRSGPVPVTFRLAIGAPGARRPARPARGAHDPRRVTAGRVLRRGAGHRRDGQRPATVRYRARGSGPGCPATYGGCPQHPLPLQRGTAPLVHALRARPARPSRDRPGPVGLARRRCALEAVEKLVTAPKRRLAER